MPTYAFLMYGDETGWADQPPGEWDTGPHERFAEQVAAAGARIVGGRALLPSSTATTVRSVPGEAPLITDGPFVEAREALGGFYLVEADDLDDALRLAALVPEDAVEVRPVAELGDVANRGVDGSVERR